MVGDWQSVDTYDANANPTGGIRYDWDSARMTGLSIDVKLLRMMRMGIELSVFPIIGIL